MPAVQLRRLTLTQKSILVVDDEQTVREVIKRYLIAAGFAVLEAKNGPEALSILEEKPPDLIVLDVMLPGIDGFALTRALRETPSGETRIQAKNTPLILLTARREESDRLRGFELGADDYVVKPFSPKELVLRIQAVLKRGVFNNSPDHKELVFKDFSIDPSSRTARIAGQTVSLTSIEFDLLWFMARNPRQVFTRQQLLDRVWGPGYYGDESTVTVHVRRIREKIELDPSNPKFLLTVWGVGYRFEANPSSS